MPRWRSTARGSSSIARPSVAPATHHGWPVARPKLSTVGCTVSVIAVGSGSPARLAISVRARRTRPVTIARSLSSAAGSARRMSLVLAAAGAVGGAGGAGRGASTVADVVASTGTPLMVSGPK